MTEEVSPASTDAGDTAVSGGASSAEEPRPAARRSGKRRLAIAALGFVACVILLHGLVVETFTVPSSSMNPTLWQGDRIIASKVGTGSLRRGEVVVFNGTEVFADPGARAPGGLAGALRSIGDTFGFRPTETLYVKRVIGLPGDRVAVGHDGLLRVNGAVRLEPYLVPGTSASDTPFSVQVPAGHIFVLGDNRSDSDDSRAHLGDPGGGMVPTDDVVGEVVLRYWPTGSWGRLGS
ncbi:signal peptidase I [Flexivirga sp. ID2601S]|uniref:Signal peptidase I n=1 Tax=Flexivirga aerilata TaxID=1656889 RepID=A0A849AJM8_9MICO|nr:signal peptidase I [Flexivirga aerilata]NNG39736.1 signal peptidase I [Flexivirga aerilata]